MTLRRIETPPSSADSPDEGVEEEGPSDIPRFESFSGLFDAARKELSHVVLDDDILGPAERLEQSGSVASWVDKCARAIWMLDEYARTRTHGDGVTSFRDWLMRHPRSLLSANSVVQQESDWVMNTDRARQQRRFPVPAEVNQDGSELFLSHVRIGWSKTHTPRLHYYDDTSGRTGKVYVGYHLLNSRTN